MALIKYIIADDHKIFRQGLKFALYDDHRLKCIGEAADGKELLEILETQKPDVILMDIKMPEMDGIEATTLIKSRYPSIRILILSMHEDEQFILHLLQIGANGYMIKNAEPEEIKKAIHSVVENEFYFNNYVSSVMLKKIRNKTPVKSPGLMALTDKEVEVIRLICKEYTAAEIAEKLFLSTRTIEGIRSSLLTKLGLKNTVGLALYAMKNNLMD